MCARAAEQGDEADEVRDGNVGAALAAYLAVLRTPQVGKVSDVTARPLPQFKYHPDPLATGAIEAVAVRCEACGLDSPYRYCYHLFTVASVGDICPWCIADGTACRKYDGELVDRYVLAGFGTPEARDEVSHRTPAYSGAEQAWPDHCNDFCAFLGNASWTRLASYEAEVSPDLELLAHGMRLSVPELRHALGDEGWLTGYLFRCLHCGHHRCYADAD